MKRARDKICCVCNGKWDERQLRTERKAFDALNPKRDPASHQPLNEPQRAYLCKNFRTPSGPLREICYVHCSELASIDPKTFYSLRKDFDGEAAGTHFSLEKPPKRKIRKHAHNATPPEAIAILKTWCQSNSSDVPNSVNIRRFNAPMTSKKKAYFQFREENPAHEMCKNTFNSLLAHHCPGLKV